MHVLSNLEGVSLTVLLGYCVTPACACVDVSVSLRWDDVHLSRTSQTSHGFSAVAVNIKCAAMTNPHMYTYEM